MSRTFSESVRVDEEAIQLMTVENPRRVLAAQ
jgi:hypothetical protein